MTTTEPEVEAASAGRRRVVRRIFAELAASTSCASTHFVEGVQVLSRLSKWREVALLLFTFSEIVLIMVEWPEEGNRTTRASANVWSRIL